MFRRSLRRTLLMSAALSAAPLAARAQVPYVRPHHASLAPVDKNTPVTFTADKVHYDRDTGLVTASGHVEAWQNEHVLRADSITYDRNTNVLAARGHVAIVEPDGETMFSDYAEVTQGMRDGILKNIRAILADNGRMVANGARRSHDGNITEMSRAVYSTCNLCKSDPTAAPLWQIRAYSATQDKIDHKIEYRDMYMDMFGVPVAYFPWFSHADPSVKRESGFLIPSLGTSQHLGAFFSIPYYWVIDNQSDLEIRPLVGAEGVGDVDFDYRRRFNSGKMNIDTSFGIDRQTNDGGDLGHTAGGPQAAIFAKGQFSYDDEWRYGFDLEGTTSRDYLRDFRLPNDQSVLTSQAYIEGFGVGSYARLDARAYQAMTDSYNQNDLPYVLPRYEYSFVGEPDQFGGRLSVDAGAFNVLRQDGTKTQRASLTGNYVRPFEDTIGGKYNVTLHLDSAVYNATDLNQLPNYSSDTTANTARALPQVAFNWRMPFVKNDTASTTLIEPIVQVIGAPNVGNSQNKLIPNEDSYDFEFSDANLFAFNRYAGIDRLEGGTRVNYALHGDWTAGSQQIDGLIGQSYQFHKDDTYLWGSGLENRMSDIVGHLGYTPATWLDLNYRTRMDPNDFKLHMADATATVGPKVFQVTGGYMYENINPFYLYDTATPPASYFTPRNELTLGISSQFSNYKFSTYARRDMKSNNLVDVGGQASYENECFALAANFDQRYTSIDGDHGGTTLLLQVTFKTVGQVGYHAM